MLNDKMRALIERNTLAMVATVSADGHPRVSPKGTTVVVDERRLAFSNIRSPSTVANIQVNPAVELNFIDVLRRQACRIEGHALYHPRGEARFEALLPLFATWPELLERMQGFVEVEISKAQLIYSPVYDVGQSEDELIAHWSAYYGSLGR